MTGVTVPALRQRVPASTGTFLAALWALVLVALQCGDFFRTPSGAFWANHDGYSYPLRLLEFDDCLAHGYWSPQWCSHFRGGLGSPYFNYYQPGLFYVASALPSMLSPVWRLGLAVALYSLAGFAALFAGLRPRYGTLAATVAGTFLLTAPYGATELSIRGDFSEYCGMMLVPVVAWAALRCGERRDFRAVAVLAGASGALIATHPVVALLAYGGSAVALASCLTAAPLRRAACLVAAGLGGGVLVSAFYWLPHFTEVRYVAASRAAAVDVFGGFFHYANHFVEPLGLVDFSRTDSLIPVKFGSCHMVVLIGALLVSLRAWRSLDAATRRQLLLWTAAIAGCVFLMSRSSEFLWRWLPLLDKLQFPWRVFAVLTPAAAWLAGLRPRIPPAPWRGGALVFCLLLLLAARFRPPPARVEIQEVARAEELAEFYFAPDVAGEWMPLTGLSWAGDMIEVGRAQHYLWPGSPPPPEVRQPVIGRPPEPGPHVAVSKWRREQGRFVCEVTAQENSYVVIPQLYFPLGWTARIDATACALHPSADGLTQVSLPAGASGTLELRCQMTPARRWGWAISLVSGLALVWGALLSRPASVPTAQPRPDHVDLPAK